MVNVPVFWFFSIPRVLGAPTQCRPIPNSHWNDVLFNSVQFDPELKDFKEIVLVDNSYLVWGEQRCSRGHSVEQLGKYSSENADRVRPMSHAHATIPGHGNHAFVRG